MKNHALLAKEQFLKGYNCAQAVACAYCDELGMDEATVAKLVSSFGGGFGKMREVCGTISGAAFVLGALRGYSDPKATDEKTAHYARIQELGRRFKAEHETLICRELLKNLELKKENTPEPEARTEDYYRTRPCLYFVETAAKIVEDMLEETSAE